MFSIISKEKKVFFSPNLNLVNKRINDILGSSLRYYKIIASGGYRWRWFLKTSETEGRNQTDFNNIFNREPNGVGVTYNQNINWSEELNKPSYLPLSNFAWEVTAYLRVDVAGNYEFNTRSDDGNQLEINGNIITSFYGGRGLDDGETSDPIFLPIGIHTFRYRMEQGGGAADAQVRWKKPGTTEFVFIPSSSFMINAFENAPINTTTTTTTTTTSTTTSIPLSIITFTMVGSTTWTVPLGVTEVEYLVVGGGGGGGNGYDNAGGGGGGAGMVLTGTLSVIPGDTYTVIVGDGGAGGANARVNNAGQPGENSQFSNIISLGGGQGLGSRTGGTAGLAQNTNISSATGGSGSGGGFGGKGGGGSTSNGSNNSGSTGGNGGSGTSSSITGTSITYGVGGRGGDAGTQNPGVNGTSNTGNGGRAGGAASSNSTGGGKGGSGIVVIKYGL